jgi:hypothetical protein
MEVSKAERARNLRYKKAALNATDVIMYYA